ncbi:hypothetical protein Ciccas_006959 [Cichlidogyrus casuarinus]|uniref:FHA domain-containing protein n=1 Tax=Cichlidogyrus casuarinus TaxID=1844966 RepID=A0ABD2Q489_9PLAT
MSASALAQANGLPVIEFLKQHDSHNFMDRMILYNGEIKVGRAVARFRPAANNAIFDCKVLSRSHAVILYEEQRFILRDTNSSNGTFVNNVRITKENDVQFAEREIFSGDFIRFGVEVFENGTNHGCIITQVKLYHPNGAEAHQRLHFEPMVECFSHEQLFQLASHVNEALFRERTIGKKLDELRDFVVKTKESAEKNWIAMLDEERLLDKLELYENQLRILKTDLPEDSLHSKLMAAYEEKNSYERNSKKLLEKRLEEKHKALLRVTELETCLADSEREAKRLREGLELSQDAYQSVANNLEQKLKELENLDKKLTETSDEKGDLESKLLSTTEEFHALRSHVSSLKPSVETQGLYF